MSLVKNPVAYATLNFSYVNIMKLLYGNKSYRKARKKPSESSNIYIYLSDELLLFLWEIDEDLDVLNTHASHDSCSFQNRSFGIIYRIRYQIQH